MVIPNEDLKNRVRNLIFVFETTFSLNSPIFILTHGLIAVQNKALIDKNLSKQVDLWKIFYVEKNKPSPTFLTVLEEMWEGAKFFSPCQGGRYSGGLKS